MDKQYRIGVIGFFLIVSLLSMSFVQPVQSATFPERAITVMVPYAAGGRSDLTIRFVAQFMKDYLGQPIVVENKPGASSVLGTVQVINAKPDGYTLLVGSAPLITAPYMVETPITYKDLAPIGRITYDPAILVINPNKLKVKDLKEFLAYAKKNPKEIMVAVDPGQSNELHALAFAKAAGLEFRYVPYKGVGSGS